MKMNVTLFLYALSIVLISVSCQSLGQALSKDSATISGQFSDLKSAFDAGMAGMSTQIKDAVSSAQNQLQSVLSGTNTKDALANLGAKVGDMSTQVKEAVSTAQNQVQTAIAGNGTQVAQVAATKDALTNLGTKVGDAVSNAQNQLQTAVSGNGAQVTATKDVLSNLGTKVGDVIANAQNQLQTVITGNSTQVAATKEALSNLGTKIGDAVTKVSNDTKNFAKVFWNNDASTKLHTSAQKLLDFKGVDAKYSAPKDELAKYMVNTQSQPNITDMINLARKHLTSEEASKFFDQMASIAEQQKW